MGYSYQNWCSPQLYSKFCRVSLSWAVKFFLSSLLILFFTVHAAIEKDRVHQLPGWNCGELPNRMWSGYVPASSQRHIHYVFVAASLNPDATLVLWLQGGPGASGMLGLLTEMGPLVVNDRSVTTYNQTVPTLLFNPFAWTQEAHILFIESPAGVGYSYCDGDCPTYTDEITADDNLAFLKHWFEGFPEYRSHRFIIAGESYGGVYVPMLAQRVIRDMPDIPLEGVAVGNGCTGNTAEGTCGVDAKYWTAEFLYGHGQYSSATHDKLMKDCGQQLRNNSLDSHCQDLHETMLKEVGGFFQYNVYDECVGRHDLAGKARRLTPIAGERNGPFGRSQPLSWEQSMKECAALSEAQDGYSCGAETIMNWWLNVDNVKTALNVEGSWIDYDGDWDHYPVGTAKDVRPLYQELLEKGKRVLIYYGDTDPSVTYKGGEYWVTRFAKKLGLKEVQQWRPWTIDGATQTAGHVIRYEKNLDFLLLRGAGHMVPRYKPPASLLMFSYWLHQMDWPPYTPPEENALGCRGSPSSHAPSFHSPVASRMSLLLLLQHQTKNQKAEGTKTGISPESCGATNLSGNLGSPRAWRGKEGRWTLESRQTPDGSSQGLASGNLNVQIEEMERQLAQLKALQAQREGEL